MILVNMNLNGFSKRCLKFFRSTKKIKKGLSAALLVWPNSFPSVKTNFWWNYYTFRWKYFFGRKPVNMQKWFSITFLSLLPISEIPDHMKYLEFILTNTTISCIIQSTFYRCEFCWNWCDTQILFIIFLRRCLNCFKI